MAITRRTAQVAVTEVATPLVVAAAGKTVIGISVSPTGDIFIGASGVAAATGVRLLANTTYSESGFTEWINKYGSPPDLYGIRAAAGTTTTYVEVIEIGR